MKNIILQADGYKYSHWQQYPRGIKDMHCYVAPRGGDRVCFFGLQAFLHEYLMKPVTAEDVIEAADLCSAYSPVFNYDDWMRLVEKHNGRLPIEIFALPEGTYVQPNVPMVVVHATDPEFFWLPSFLETALLRAVWYPSTVATVSGNVRRQLQEFANMTSDDPDAIMPTRLHDFGARGVSSGESAALGGMAHLVHFQGTDTTEALLAARRYYGARTAGTTVAAAEHSTITSWRSVRGWQNNDGEVMAYRNMLNTFAKYGIFSVVIDSYDTFRAVTDYWGSELKQNVIDSGALVVLRPDSGDPLTVVRECLLRAAAAFGTTTNGKGFKILNHVRILQGDGVNPKSIAAITEMMQTEGFALDNIVFGMGGALLQQVNRDTFKFAQKASAVYTKHWTDVYKDPATDPGKSSLRGRVIATWDYEKQDYGVSTIPAYESYVQQNMVDMPCVYRDGMLLKRYSMDEVRAQATKTLK